MIDLDNHRSPLLKFVNHSISEFSRLHHEIRVTCVALYCCPWAGWVSINFDTNRESYNCPDFSFCAFKIYDVQQWQDECAKNELLLRLNGEIIHINDEEDDETLNNIVFRFLVNVMKQPEIVNRVIALNRDISYRIGVQMLDSEYVDFWEQ